MKALLRRPWIVVAVTAAVTVFFALQLPRVVLDNDIVNFIPKDAPEVKALESQSDIYGTQVQFLVGLKRTAGTVFEKDFLLALRDLTARLEALDLVESVTSLANTDDIRGEGDAIVVKTLLDENFSGTPEEILQVKERILSWDLYRDSLVSADFRSTQLLISLVEADKSSDDPRLKDPKKAVFNDVSALLAAHAPADTEVFMAGTPVMAVLMSRNMVSDLVVLIPLVVLVIIATLFLSFRRLGGVLLPLLTVVIAAVWTIGLMALLGVTLTMVGTVIPVILMAVGSAYGIHVLSHYYDHALQHKDPKDKEGHLDLIDGVIRKISLPVLLAGLTTMAGFGSLAITSLIPIRDFGIFTTFGVGVALIVALTLLPALLVIRGPKALKGKSASLAVAEEPRPADDPISRLLLAVFLPFSKHPKLTLWGSLAILGVGIWGASQIVVDNAVVEFFKPDTAIARSDAFLRSDFGGTKTFNINFKGSARGDLNDPAVLALMDDLAAYLETEFPEVGKVISYSQFIKRMNQVINADEPAEGLRGGVVAAAEDAPGAFGFDEAPGFGFDEAPAFGFDSFDDSAPAAEPAPAEAPADDPALTRAALLTLLNEAYALSDHSRLEARDLLALINRTTNYQGAAYYEIPQDPERYNQADAAGLKNLIGNYLVLVGAGTGSFADDPLEPSQARMTIQVNSTGNLATQKIATAAQAWAQGRLPENVKLEIAGMALIEKGVTDLITGSLLWNVISSVAMVMLILAIFFRSTFAGLISTLPLLLSILVSFAVMGIFRIKLDAATSMVASVAIGTGIDYTIHLLVAFHRGRRQHQDYQALMSHTILTTGKAIVFNAVTVALGFMVLLFSQFNPLVYLGLLVALTMFTSSFAALTLMPVILNVLKPKFLDKPFLIDTLGGDE